MAVWIDRKYLLLLSNKLMNFKQKKEDLFQFRCPFCNDSKKNKIKSRGYIYRKGTDFLYRCHNCNEGYNMYNFISKIDNSLCRDYSLEVFKETSTGNFRKDSLSEFKQKAPVFETTVLEVGKINLPSISSLPDDNIAKEYVLSRKIPKGSHKDLFYAEDFKSFISEFKPDYDKTLLDNDPRLIIPFRDKNKKVFAIQGRSLNGSNIRYITIKLYDDELKIFGVDKLDYTKKIYVTEGPIDSLFLNNAVATADSNLMIAEFLGKDKIILVYDNEPRNPQIVKQIQKSIDNGFKICLFPESFKAKDINDAILNGFSKPEIYRIIDTHTYDGLRAKMEFNKWKKC